MKRFDGALRGCIKTSQRYAGIRSPTGKHFYASVLFTSLCTRGITLGIVSPHSSWATKSLDHWDYASVAVLTRSILEIRLAFFYLCVERCSPEEWDCRWNLFNLHDCGSRMRLFETMDPTAKDIEGFKDQEKELRSRLTANGFFMSLPEKQRNRFLNGGGPAYLYSLEDIAAKAGVEKADFQLLYRLLSNHVHGLPMSFYRMGEQERGRGVHSETEEGYTAMCLAFCAGLFDATLTEMEELFCVGK